MIAKDRKVEIYLNSFYYAQTFPISYTIGEIEQWMKHSTELIHQLQENKQPKIPSDSNLVFKYNSPDGNVTNKTLKLNEFHPTKRLIYYVEASNTQSSSQSVSKGPSVAVSTGSSGELQPAKSGSLQNIQDNIYLTLYMSGNQQPKTINVSRKMTFKQLTDQINIATKNMKVICTRGSDSRPIIEYARIEQDELRKYFENDNSGKVQFKYVFEAGKRLTQPQ